MKLRWRNSAAVSSSRSCSAACWLKNPTFCGGGEGRGQGHAQGHAHPAPTLNWRSEWAGPPEATPTWSHAPFSHTLWGPHPVCCVLLRPRPKSHAHFRPHPLFCPVLCATPTQGPAPRAPPPQAPPPHQAMVPPHLPPKLWRNLGGKRVKNSNFGVSSNFWGPSCFSGLFPLFLGFPPSHFSGPFPPFFWDFPPIFWI